MDDLERRLADLPAWQHDNEWILTGYRPEMPDWRRVLYSSIGYLHNETGAPPFDRQKPGSRPCSQRLVACSWSAGCSHRLHLPLRILPPSLFYRYAYLSLLAGQPSSFAGAAFRDMGRCARPRRLLRLCGLLSSRQRVISLRQLSLARSGLPCLLSDELIDSQVAKAFNRLDYIGGSVHKLVEQGS